jgi:hypothetical protein
MKFNLRNPLRSELGREAGGKSFAFRIYVVALVLRLLPVILARGLGIGLDDMFQYDMLARSLAGGHGFRWYAQTDLNQLASYVDFDLTSVKDYDPILGIRRRGCAAAGRPHPVHRCIRGPRLHRDPTTPGHGHPEPRG